jgi:hypothetical protein
MQDGNVPVITNRCGIIRASLASGIHVESVKISGTSVGKNGIVFYEIQAQNSEMKWNVVKRFKDFWDLHKKVVGIRRSMIARKAMSNFKRLPQFPTRLPKFIVHHSKPYFIAERRSVLENYLVELVQNHSDLSVSEVFIEFIVPKDIDPFVPRSTVERNLFVQEALYRESSCSAWKDANFPREITMAKIKGIQQMTNQRVLYVIDLENREHDMEMPLEWTVMKSYQDFFEFDEKIRESLMLRGESALLRLIPSIPPKQLKFITDHHNKNFIENRTFLLQNYLNKIIEIPVLYSLPEVNHFFHIE